MRRTERQMIEDADRTACDAFNTLRNQALRGERFTWRAGQEVLVHLGGLADRMARWMAERQAMTLLNGQPLTEEEVAGLDVCVCGHVRRHHDAQDGCYDIAGGSYDCPCETFERSAWGEESS